MVEAERLAQDRDGEKGSEHGNEIVENARAARADQLDTSQIKDLRKKRRPEGGVDKHANSLEAWPIARAHENFRREKRDRGQERRGREHGENHKTRGFRAVAKP